MKKNRVWGKNTPNTSTNCSLQPPKYSQQESAQTVRSGKLSSWVQIHRNVGTQYDTHIRVQWKNPWTGEEGRGKQTTMIKWRFCHGSCYAERCPTSHQCSFYTLDSHLPTLMYKLHQTVRAFLIFCQIQTTENTLLAVSVATLNYLIVLCQHSYIVSCLLRNCNSPISTRYRT